MIPLLRIRLKYLKRHCCLLFWTYIFIPSLVFATAIISFLIGKETINKYEKTKPIIYEELEFNKIDNFNFISNYLEYSLFVVEDETKCSEIQKLISKETNQFVENVNCSISEKNVTSQTSNIIKIKKVDDKYRANLEVRGAYGNLFSNTDLEQDIITNAFIEGNDTSSEKNRRSKSTDNNNKRFFQLQSLLSKIIVEVYEQKKFEYNFNMTFGYNPFPEHYEFTSQYDYYTYAFLSFIIALQFSLISYNFNMRMIDEKENKLNILLERQGISKFKYNLSWLITFYALFFFSIISFTLLICYYLNFHYFLFILNMLFFSFSIFTTCLFFTACNKTTKTGMTAVKFFNFGSIFIGFVIVLPKASKIAKIIFCFIPQINIYVSLCSIFNLNNFENLSWDLIWLKSAKMSFMESIIMYIVEIIFYLGLSLIIQSYKDSGLNFIPYLKSFFTKVSREVNNKTNLLIENQNNNIDNDKKEGIKFNTYHQELSNVNQQKLEANQCLKIINVSKNFDDVKAVDNFNGQLFSNEIFCLLGHNGAGKTTLINMISGIIDPSYGDILLNGQSIVTNKDYLYQNIGLCQQEDIFFDYLTVQEHLEYMCRIKGSAINYEEINDLINRIELAPKKNALCKTLSGGQKRKLCIALALIGGSQIILLDEPTSGMDVMARRALWEFLKNYKTNKIILLTTHFLDEAEYLGDRIGIMTDGHFLCSGTSSFLKSKYPCGFYINLLINPSIFNEEYKQQFYNGILQYEPNAEIKVASKGVFSINIQSNNQHIQELFDYIEQTRAQFGIQDYTVGSTSLEDVFLKINNKASLNDLKYTKENIKNEQFVNAIPISAGFCSQLVAQIVRGIYPFWRNKTLFFFELLSSLGFVYIFIFFFSDFIINITKQKLDLIEVLEAHKIYFYENTKEKDFLKKSDTYDNLGTYITLKELEQSPNDIISFMELVYEKSFAHIGKGALYVDSSDPYFYKVYNSEVYTGLYGYFYANTMLFVSAFLKEKYGIDATFFKDISYDLIGNESLNDSIDIIKDSIVLIIVCFITIIGFVMFLGGLMFEKIKEKRTNIKHLFYLSGGNTWSYWIGFYVVDYIKLLIFTIFLIIPIYYVNPAGTYFGLDLLSINFSSLSFIYFISFFCSKDDAGAKVLFFFVFGYIIIIGLLLLIIYKISDDSNDIVKKLVGSLTDSFNLTIFDLTPITSMNRSFIVMIISYNIYNFIDKILELFSSIVPMSKSDLEEIIEKYSFGFKRPKEYLFSSYLIQFLNFVIYTMLLILAESGLLQILIHKIELKLYGNSYVFGKEEVSEDFINYNNNIDTPLIHNTQSNNMYGDAVNVPINNNNMNNIDQPYNYNNNIINTNQNQNIQIMNPPNMINNNSNKDPLSNPYVQKEIEKLNTEQKIFSTRITNLTKTFFPCCKPNVRAINNLYLGLEPNEKFGLLGFNGSGKTTTFRAITNEILYDSGSISLFNFDTKTQFENIRTMIGYCPQINPLFDFMKVKEIIKFYSELKNCNENVESVCEKFGLSKYLETYTINLSGGNKRKLTFAIAMMNRPSLLLLDEPSTGVDPESRRIMWRNINELSNSGHQYNMILTTHSMEEAEILCDTVSWFKAGNFIAKGNPEELKIHYSAGYKLHVKFDDSIAQYGGNSSDFNNVINETFNQACILIEGLNVYSNYILSNTAVEPYLRQLIVVVQKIKDKTQRIFLSSFGKDLSFELVLSIIKERQKDLFIEVLNMKNTDKTISELSIAMQSLENILTSLK